jgi:hypothetical protein
MVNDANAPASAPTTPTREQIEALVAAGRDPAPYFQTYTDASGAASEGGETSGTCEHCRGTGWIMRETPHARHAMRCPCTPIPPMLTYRTSDGVTFEQVPTSAPDRLREAVAKARQDYLSGATDALAFADAVGAALRGEA